MKGFRLYILYCEVTKLILAPHRIHIASNANKKRKMNRPAKRNLKGEEWAAEVDSTPRQTEREKRKVLAWCTMLILLLTCLTELIFSEEFLRGAA